MKNKLFIGVGALALALTSCSEDWGPSGSEGGGYITPLVEVDNTTISSRAESGEDDPQETVITKDDLTLKLSKKDGTQLWDGKLVEFPTTKQFAVGNYKLEAYKGDPTDEGFNKPAVYGSQDLEVKDGETTSVSLIAKPSNARITLDYEDSFKKYMTEWDAQINSTKYTQEETRPVYVAPGDVTIKLNFTKANGVKGSFTLDPIEVKAGYQYNVKLSVNGGEVGEGVLEVTFDSNLDEEKVEIDLSDKVLTAPKPVIDTDGFVTEVPVEVIAGLTESKDLSMSVIAMAGLSSVMIETESPSLQQQGWPKSVDLMSADAPRDVFTKLGLNVLGLWNKPGEMAYIDFSSVVEHIELEEGESTTAKFTLTAKDKILRESDPVTLILNVKPVELELSLFDKVYNPGSNVKVYLTFNGTLEDVEKNVKFSYLHGTGVHRELTVKDVKAENGKYIVELIVPAGHNDELELIAECAGVKSELTVPMAPFKVEVDERNVFATYAFVKIVPTLSGSTISINNPVFEGVVGDEDNFSTLKSEVDTDGYYKVSDLSPNSNYQIRIIMDGMTSKTSKFTTEEAAQVPNGDFEQTEQLYNETSMMSGGYFSVANAGNYNNSANFSYYEAKGWTSTNSKTMNGTTRNTWYVQPSVCSTESSYTGIGSGIGGGTSAGSSKSSEYSIVGYEGISMIIRNIGWSQDSEIPEKMNQGLLSGKYFNSNVPKFYDKEVGKLFLGNYSYDVDSRTEVISEGITFNSRPNSLKGYYKYSLDKSNQTDSGTIIIQICQDDIIIQKIEKILEPTSTFTSFKIPINYSKDSLKANKLCLMIKSSTLTNDNVNVYPFVNRYESFFHGATLVVDDLEFEY